MKVLYFGAEWCCQCKAVKPQVEKLCKDNNIELEIIDAGNNEKMVAKYNIKNLPSIIILNEDGTIQDAAISFDGVELIKKLIKSKE